MENQNAKPSLSISIGDKVISRHDIVDLGTLGCDKCGKMLTCRNGMVLMEAKDFVMAEAIRQGWEAADDGNMYCLDCSSEHNKAEYAKLMEIQKASQGSSREQAAKEKVAAINEVIAKLEAARDQIEKHIRDNGED